VLTSQKNAWKQIFIFFQRFYTNCVSTTLTVLKTLKVSISFIVTLYFLVKVLLATELWDHVNCFCKTMKQILKNVWTVQKNEVSIVLHWPWTKCQHTVAWGWVVGRQVAHSGWACCPHLHAKTANTFSAWLMEAVGTTRHVGTYPPNRGTTTKTRLDSHCHETFESQRLGSVKCFFFVFSARPMESVGTIQNVGTYPPNCGPTTRTHLDSHCHKNFESQRLGSVKCFL
jgi:hypothetical protein